MKPDEILKYCLENLEGSVLVESWGEKGIFYNPGHVLKRGVYILTVKEKDGDNDKGSRLNRPGAGGVVEMDYDFSVADCFLPHPVYAWKWKGRIWNEWIYVNEGVKISVSMGIDLL